MGAFFTRSSLSLVHKWWIPKYFSRLPPSCSIHQIS